MLGGLCRGGLKISMPNIVFNGYAIAADPCCPAIADA